LNQALSARYINKQSLVQVLDKLFGSNNYEIEIQENHMVLTIPRKLTESEIESIMSG